MRASRLPGLMMVCGEVLCQASKILKNPLLQCDELSTPRADDLLGTSIDTVTGGDTVGDYSSVTWFAVDLHASCADLSQASATAAMTC